MPIRSRPKFAGLYHDEVATDSYWIRDRGELAIPALQGTDRLVIRGELLPPDPGIPAARGALGLRVFVDDRLVLARNRLDAGPFQLEVPLPPSTAAESRRLRLHLTGVAWSNFLAWLGRVTGLSFLQAWRRQDRNRRLRLQRVEAGEDVLFDFANRAGPWNAAFARRFLRIGLNVVGFFRADLGVGESARCMARAAGAAGLPHALVDLRLPCKNPLSDETFASRLQPDAPHPVNVIHVDPPGMRDLDHHHGPGLRRGKYNIGYWAWELPDFPDAWIGCAEYCDEVWAPSRFTAEAIAQKVPVPVLAMPHAIGFDRPAGDFRPKFGLPADRFLFLFLYDLNSYHERKNPEAVLEAYRRSGLAGRGAGLVIKVHNAAGNPADFERLRAAVADLPGVILLNRTLTRRETYELESAADCFVSLHRSEGFGLAVAESMYLGKPVIATDWSGTAEYLDAAHGCPVRCSLVTLDRNHGPYARGQQWADPDLDHAADWMRRLHGDPALAGRIGAAARAAIEHRLSPAEIGARYRRRLEVIASW
ncbi:MAG TPA: glycosyltransferase family 4 protein [Lacunisphaera sp.]|nr:glycosyltransferase family 4 protein [Lacunisphaera sp.]